MRTVVLSQILLLLIVSACTLTAQEQRIVTLPMFYRALEHQNPISAINLVLDSVNALQVKNLKTSYYPKLDFNASASWQSDVTSIDLNTQNLPFSLDMPSPDRDQYKVTIDISQIIWDGGKTSARKDLVYAQHKAELGSITSEVFNLRERVNEAFFAILLLDISQERLNMMTQELTVRKESLESGVREGVILPSVLQSLQSEILRLQQKLLELAAQKASLSISLEKLTGLKVDITDKFVQPELTDEKSIPYSRPEIYNFAHRRDVFDARSNLTSRMRMPTLAGFISSGYGKPGLNMLSNEWNPFVVVGARLSWNIWDWNFTNREREQLLIQKSIIDLRQKAFEDGLESAVVSTENQIEMLKQQLLLDTQVTKLLDEVKQRSESQLTNGTITSSEFLGDFNAAARARLDMEYREILLIKEKVKLRYLLGGEL